MKAISKRVLSLGLSLAMVASVIAVPSTEAQAATGIAKSKTYYVGQTKTLKLTTSSKWKNVKTTWSTSKKSIVKIAKKTNKTVTINCVKAGKANVTAKVSFKKGTKKYTKKYTCKVTVKNPTFKVSAGQTTLKLGETTAIKVTKKPSSAVIKYSSDDAAIAKISGGKITATGIGTTKINARMKIGNQTVARKSVEITVVPSEDGVTAVLSNPFTADYPNTVLVNQNAIINVACVRDGKPVAGEVVVLTATKKTGAPEVDYGVQGNTTATTNSNGIAAFVIANKASNVKSSDAGEIASVNYTVSVPGSDSTVTGSVDFAAVTYENVDIINNNSSTDKYPNLVPGTNYVLYGTTTLAGDGQAETASMDGEVDLRTKTWDDEYVESQQVSSADSDEHAVYVGGGYPMIKFPTNASDLSSATKKVDPVDVTYGPYETYETHSEYVTLKEDPRKLTYAALNFDYLKLSKYTRAVIETFASEDVAKAAAIPATAAASFGENCQIYDGEQNQGSFFYQIPLDNDYAKCVVKITIQSAGQVDTAMNAGYKASSIEYVYKTGSSSTQLPVKGADVTWSIVDTQYTAETELKKGAQTCRLGSNGQEIVLGTDERLTYKMPRFPYTGTAVLTHYDANGKVKAYYAFATVNNGINQNILGQDNRVRPVMVNNNNGVCYKITSDELRDNVGTIVSQDGSIAKVNSYQSGRTTLEGKVTVNGKIVEALDAETNTMYTSIQWNPIPNGSASSKAFVAFVGQNIEVIAQLVDKNGNAVTQSGQNVTFSYSKNGTPTNVLSSDASINSKTTPALKNVSVVKVDTETDSKGQAKLILKASDVTGIENITVQADRSKYDARLIVAEKTIDRADLYWAEAELSFTDSAISGNTTTTTASATTKSVTTGIEPLSGSTWLYGVQCKASDLADIGILAGKSVTIDGLNITMAKAASGVGAVDATTKSGQVKATSTKTGKTVIVSKINSSSVTADTKITAGDAVFAGTGTATINRTLKLEVNWINNGKTAEMYAPNGTNVVSANTIAYVKVTDTNGNPVSGNTVKLKADGADLDVTTATTNSDGIAAVLVKNLVEDKRATVTATVEGISDQTYTITYTRKAATSFTFDTAKDDITEKYKATFDKSTGIITLVFNQDIVASSVIADGITAKYGDSTNMGVDSVSVDGNIVSIKVVNVPGTISADDVIKVTFATKTVKSVDYTMTSENGDEFVGTVNFKANGGATAPY